MRHWSIRPGRRHRAGRTRSQAPAGRLIRRELSSPVWCHVTGETHERIGRAARLASIPSYPDVRDRRNPLHSSSGKKKITCPGILRDAHEVFGVALRLAHHMRAREQIDGGLAVTPTGRRGLFRPRHSNRSYHMATLSSTTKRPEARESPGIICVA